jgi:hypothetical protein
MEFRNSITTSNQDNGNAGYIELLYMELSASQSKAVGDGNSGKNRNISGVSAIGTVNEPLNASSAISNAIDDVFRSHKPFSWSVDVGIGEDTSDPQASRVPARILYYSASADGSHVATLSTKDRILQLDMWDLETASRSAVDVTNTTTGTICDVDDWSEHRAAFSPISCGQYQAIQNPVATDMCKYII